MKRSSVFTKRSKKKLDKNDYQLPLPTPAEAPSPQQVKRDLSTVLERMAVWQRELSSSTVAC